MGSDVGPHVGDIGDIGRTATPEAAAEAAEAEAEERSPPGVPPGAPSPGGTEAGGDSGDAGDVTAGAGEMSADRTHMPRREGSEASLISRHPKHFMSRGRISIKREVQIRVQTSPFFTVPGS